MVRYAPFARPWMQRSLFRVGVPIFIIVIGGSFYLKDFTKLRYKYRAQKQITPEDFEKIMGVPMKKKPVNFEEELKKAESEVQSDYTMIRGPRPDEPWTAYDTMKKERLAEKAQQKAGKIPA
ncbi:hypothetical protein RvY_09897 [Ramazzottius varieornatus]|uniref:Cytochrome c oxidase assembly protein COX16 homolog, mitochondrial n=1 Tax=Ramazzottius varieornatus TaxID=947166 RepID=A0A1D1VFD8_RAMVA|nr:hypothetical protein RvY_09897 [Ramazzottius varieornatus]